MMARIKKQEIIAPNVLTIEMPMEGFTPEKLENLKKMIDSKAALIKKVLSVEGLPIEVTEETIKFPWFAPDLPAVEIQAYSQFVAALCNTAKEKTRITACPQEEFENEKFAMRVWLIGLGATGAEYALCRKLLMKNLSGDSSWRYSKPENGTPRQRRERIHRDVISVRFTPDTLVKLATLAADKHISRNILIESVIEDYIHAAFPASEPTADIEPETAPETE